ncbi:serine/threonine-protein kinase [Kitasatospora sp. NPDC052896]|uniref:serine/threonine-protein kinase n=1 Tax=Kitasatospora sp. NPDC052896 TaxID=3364061 RepID=UPI0037CAF59F
MEFLRPEDPRQLGGYRLLRRLGAGGMGQVYLGRTPGGRTVAVKTVHREYATDQEFRARFRQEVAAARRVGGRWTAPVLDADTESDHPWVATGYVAGPSLGSAVREFGPLPTAAARSLGIGLAEALGAVHRLGLVHRDVKPSNVLLALDGPRLIDFGITRALDAATALTRSGFVVGSPGYLSPEQAQGLAAGPPSDVFSLGAVLAFAASGTPPFGEGVSAPVLLYRVLHEAPELGELDEELRVLVLACLAKQPADRPTPDELRALLAGGGQALPAPGAEDWLPPAVAASVARLAVELLDLDGAGEDAPAAAPATEVGGPSTGTGATGGTAGAGAPTGRFGPPPTAWTPAEPTSHPGPVPPAAPAPLPGWTAPTPAAPPAAPARPRRGWALAAVAAALAAAVAGAAVWLSNGNGGTHSGPIAAAFLGSWRGALTSSAFPTPVGFQITIVQGRPGSEVGAIRNSAGDTYCDSSALLTTAGAGRLVLTTAQGSASNGCTPDSDPQVYTVNSNGSLHLTISGYSGDLTREG